MNISKNESESLMSEALTANPITPYAQVSTPPHSNNNGGHNQHESFSDNPVQRSTSNDGYSTGSNDSDDDNDDDDEADLSLASLLYSASSYHAIMRPVSITMTLAALAAVYINNEQTMEMTEEQFATAYNVWQIDDSAGGASNGKHLAASIVNTFVMISVIAAMTFGIVILYKYRCMKFLIGYMVMSSASLLGVLGDYMGSIAIEIYRIPVDRITWTVFMYNFAIVGVTAIFYQKGIPSGITQMYLVCTSVILAWHLSHFDDWTAWTLLVMLAFYDLCAVLSPCGPLKALVNLMQQEDSPDMPGLLYEAQLPPGAVRPNGRSNTSTNHSNNNSNARSNARREEEENDDSSSGEEDSYYSEEEGTRGRESESAAEMESATESATPLTNGSRAIIPLALAKVYRLPLVSHYGAAPSSSSTRRRGRSRHRSRDSSSVINESPLLADASSPEEFYERQFTEKELSADVEVEFPRNGGRIEKDDDGGRSGRERRYRVFGKNGELRRTLIVNRKGKVYEVNDDGDDDDDGDDESEYEEKSSIRLGLGDFIFYSVMVAKAAMYSFTTFAACMLVILAGLGGTLVLLSVYHSALPALPISIFLGVIFYLMTKLVIEPWIEVMLTAPIYV